MRLGYRGAELLLLRDGRSWCRAIGVNVAGLPTTAPWSAPLRRPSPDDGSPACWTLANWFMLDRLLGTTLAVNSTCYDTHHRSRYYDRRCRHDAEASRRSADAKRSRTARTTPKLGVAVDTRVRT